MRSQTSTRLHSRHPSIWNTRIVFKADHKAYRELGLYDFGSETIKTRLMNGVLALLLKTQGFSKEFRSRMKEEMIKSDRKQKKKKLEE